MIKFLKDLGSKKDESKGLLGESNRSNPSYNTIPSTSEVAPPNSLTVKTETTTKPHNSFLTQFSSSSSDKNEKQGLLNKSSEGSALSRIGSKKYQDI